ncbi:MAG: MraY family glycosyltransferase [Desulfuromonadales bacterium]
MLTTSFYVFMTAMFTSLIMVPVLRRWALKQGAVDVPDERKVHSVAVPRIGGIAIFMSFLFSHLVYVDIDPQVRGALAGGIVIFFTGLIDDLHGLSPRSKFVGEIASVVVAVAVSGLYISHLGDPFGFGSIMLPVWLAIPFTVFAVVGVINAINLMDGLDGLAGGLSAIALIVFGVLAFQNGNAAAVFICAGMLGALLGFLKFNFYPARIFMGDAGSLTLGYILAFLAISITQSPSSTVSPVTPVLVLGVPLLDTLWVMGRRVLAGTSPFSPDRTHLHHKFLSLGLNHRFTVIVIYQITLFWSTVAIVFYHWPDAFLLWGYLLTALACYVALRFMLNHPKRFAFMKLDSSLSLRRSNVYLHVAGVVDKMLPFMMVLLMGYLMAVSIWGDEGFRELWRIAGILFVALLALLYLTRSSSNYFFLAMFYAAGMVTIFVVDANAQQLTPFGWRLGEITPLVFGLAGGIVGLKVLFRYEGEFFISTPDMLILGLSVFFGFYSFHFHGGHALSDIFFMGVIFLLAVKAIGFKNKVRNRIMVYSSLMVLFIISLRGLLASL